MSFRARTTISGLIITLLAGCGGGGGDSTVASTAQPSSAQPSTPANTGTSTGGDGTPASSSTTPADTGTSPTTPVPPGSVTPVPPPPNGSTDPSTAPASTFAVDETARFNVPSDITIDSGGNVYVMDRGNLVIRRIALTGEVSTLPGSYDAGARLAMDASGNLFVMTGTDIFKLSPDGNRTLIASHPVQPGSSTPIRISLDAQGRLYVLLRYRNVFRVDRIDVDTSSRTVYSFLTYGEAIDFASDAQGNLAVGYVGPAGGQGSITLVPQSAQPAEQSSPGVSTRPPPLNNYGKLVFDTAGNLYIADAKYTPVNSATSTAYDVSDMRVIKVAPDGAITTILNGFPVGGSTTRQTASAASTIGITVGANGNLYLTDSFDHAIYRLTQSGQVTLIAGKPGEAGSSD